MFVQYIDYLNIQLQNKGMSKEIQIQGISTLSLKYIENFFKKVGDIRKLYFIDKTVIIKFQTQSSAKDALKYDGKILQQQQMIIKYRKQKQKQNKKKHCQIIKHFLPSTTLLQAYQQLDINNHLQQLTQIIDQLKIQLKKKIILLSIFKIKMNQIFFLHLHNQNSQINRIEHFFMNLLVNQKINLFSQSTNDKTQNSEIQQNNQFIYFSLKTPSIESIQIQQLKLMAEYVDLKKKFLNLLQNFSKRLYKIYTMFQREGFVKNQNINYNIESLQCDKLERFLGNIPASYTQVIFNPLKEFYCDNLLFYKPKHIQGMLSWQFQTFSCIINCPKDRYLQETNYFNIFKLKNDEIKSEQESNNNNRWKKQSSIELHNLVIIQQIKSECLNSTVAQKICDSIQYKIKCFLKTKYIVNGEYDLVLIFPPMFTELQYSLFNFKPWSKNIWIMHLTNPIIYQDLLFNRFIESYVDAYNGIISEDTAQFIAKTMIKQHKEELIGNYDIKKIKVAILQKEKEKQKRKTKSLVDKYSFFLRK